VGIVEIAQFVTLVVTGVIGWWIKRDTGKTSATNERLEGKVDAIIAHQASEVRQRIHLEIRTRRIEKFLGLPPMSPPEGHGAVRDYSSGKIAVSDD